MSLSTPGEHSRASSATRGRSSSSAPGEHFQTLRGRSSSSTPGEHSRSSSVTEFDGSAGNDHTAPTNDCPLDIINFTPN